MLSAIEQMARIAYAVKFVEISGNSETVITPEFFGGMIPFIVLRSPARPRHRSKPGSGQHIRDISPPGPSTT